MSSNTARALWWSSPWGRKLLSPFPLWSAYLAGKRIATEINTHIDSWADGAIAVDPKIDLDRLEQLLNESLELKRSLESKAVLYIGGVGIILGLATSWLGSQGSTQCIEWPLRTALALSMFYFFTAALSAHSVVRPRQWSRRTLSREFDLAGSKDERGDRADGLGWCVKLNELTCSSLANYVTAAHKHTMLGLFFLFAALMYRVLE